MEQITELGPLNEPRAHLEGCILPKDYYLPLFPNLFAFSYAVQDTDVADDIIEDCIWALSVFIHLIEEGTETVLRAVGHIKDNNDYKFSKYTMLQNARMKIVFHLLHIEHAEEAIPCGRAIIDEQCSCVDEVWLQNLAPFEIYGEALVLARTDNNEAVKMLRHAMHGVEAGSLLADSSSLPLLIRT